MKIMFLIKKCVFLYLKLKCLCNRWTTYSFFLSEAKSVVGVMLMIVFLLPASIIFAIYFILCHSTIKRSKEMLQEPVRNENSEPSKVKLKDSFISGLFNCLETANYFSGNTQHVLKRAFRCYS